MVEIGTRAAAQPGALLREAIAIAESTGAQAVGQSALEVTAGMSAALRNWRFSARLYGAAEQQAKRTANKRDAVDDAFLLPLVAMARDALSDDRFARAESAGGALGYEAALAEAAAWIARLPTGS